MVMARVRGIGVAVITRTSAYAFLYEPQPLEDAEAVLLVDDGESELLKLHVFFEKSVCADHDVR
jgi:hypothetical protein